MWTKSGRLGEGQTVATYEWGSSGLANKRSLKAVAEDQTYTLDERTFPFTSSFAVGAQDNPMPTSPPLTVMVPASALSCDTMSFHAAEESVVPAFGSAPHAAAAKETPHQTKATDETIHNQICAPFETFFTNPSIRGGRLITAAAVEFGFVRVRSGRTSGRSPPVRSVHALEFTESARTHHSSAIYVVCPS